MQNYTLSREQSLALDVIHNNDLSCILYLDKLNLASTLVASLSKSLNNGERSILFLESKGLIDALKAKVSGTSLEHLFLFLEENDYLSDHHLARIRSMIKEKPEQSRFYIDQAEKLDMKESRIFQVFADQAEKIFGERRWRDLAMLPRRTDKVLNTLKYQFELKLTQQEFWHIRGQIEEAKSLYDTGHLLSESLASIFKISIDNENTINEIKQQLNDFKKRIEGIIQDLDKELHLYKKRIHAKLEEEYIQVRNLTEEARLLQSKLLHQSEEGSKIPFSFFGNKPSEHSTIFKRYKEIQKTINDSILIIARTGPAGDHMDHESMANEIDRWTLQLADWKSHRESITIKMIKSLNKNNSDTGQFKNIDYELTKLFDEINETEIFNEILENTSLNTYNQYLSADKCLNDLKIALAYLNENKEIIIWESFFSNLPVDVQHLITALKRYDIKEWIPLYEKWYLDRLLEKHYNPDTSFVNPLLTEYTTLLHQSHNAFGQYVDGKLSQKRDKALELCKTRNKDIFNKLLKKKNVEDLRAFDIVWAEKELLSYFFPVMVIPSKLYRSNRLLKDGNWDQVYCEGTGIFEHIEKYTLLENKINFMAPLSDSFKACNDLNIKLNDKKHLCKLLIHEYNFDQPISSLPLSDRLRAAKKLSKILLSLNQQVRIFQMRNANIISILSPTLTKEMITHFDKNGIKEMAVEDSLYETVTESIIAADREQYLLYQDHLINVDHFQHFMWQREAIDSFRISGFKTIDVETIHLKNNEDYLIRILEEKIPVKEDVENILPKEA
jgi:hypothetical protein